MLEMVNRFPQYRFAIAQAPSQPDELYRELIGDKEVLLVKGNTYNLLKQATAALVTSGTATLETALFGVPQVVCYKGNAISFWLATKLVKVKYISLVNLIMDKLVVTELIQHDLTPEKLEAALSRLMNDTAYKAELKADYAELWHKLGSLPASENAAREIVALAAHEYEPK
jgi:lipid-A-disaccharide synthase